MCGVKRKAVVSAEWTRMQSRATSRRTKSYDDSSRKLKQTHQGNSPACKRAASRHQQDSNHLRIDNRILHQCIRCSNLSGRDSRGFPATHFSRLKPGAGRVPRVFHFQVTYELSFHINLCCLAAHIHNLSWSTGVDCDNSCNEQTSSASPPPPLTYVRLTVQHINHIPLASLETPSRSQHIGMAQNSRSLLIMPKYMQELCVVQHPSVPACPDLS